MKWNGHAAAVSLTFDDGLACQRDHAIPLLDKHGLPGTFFVITDLHNNRREKLVWRSAARCGHEIGGHSLTHRLLDDMTEHEARYETMASKVELQFMTEDIVVSYAYPHVLINDNVYAAAKQTYKQARAAVPFGTTPMFATSADFINWHKTPASAINPGNLRFVSAALDTAVKLGAWVTFLFHGVGPDNTQWGNISSEQFETMLDEIKKRDIWVATYRDSADKMRELQLANQS